MKPVARATSGSGAFTDAERAYLTDVHPMARLATVGSDGTPHVMPLGMYSIDPETDAIVTSGHDLATTKKWRDVLHSGRAAIVIDDVLPPFRPRGIEIRGRAEAHIDGEPSIHIYPERIVAWGLDETNGLRNARSFERGAGRPWGGGVRSGASGRGSGTSEVAISRGVGRDGTGSPTNS
jgi:pyridoxamine 5'-phosphate oxidase family protein